MLHYEGGGGDLAIITKITAQIKRKDRYNIFLDEGKGEKYAFSVDEEVLLRFDLKKGKELDEFDLADIQTHDEIQKAFTQALNYLSHRMRSESEIRQYLKKKEVEDPVIQEAVHKLYHDKYLDDLEFARAFVQTAINGGSKGPVIVQQELREKGVEARLIEQALEEYTFDMQAENAAKIAAKTIKKEKNISERALKQKLDQVLARKGFSRDAITAALDETVIEKDTEEEWDSLVFQAEKIKRRYRGLEPFEYQHKMKQALFRKGFSIEIIDRFLEEDPEQFQDS